MSVSAKNAIKLGNKRVLSGIEHVRNAQNATAFWRAKAELGFEHTTIVSIKHFAAAKGLCRNLYISQSIYPHSIYDFRR